MPPRRNIALVIAGGASLGSYEAGVMTELLYALDYINRTRKADEPEFVIDVMTGGSAGALTAALVARIMLHGYGERSRLYEAWVERINIVELMQRAPDNAVLSKDVIRKLAHDLVVEGIDAKGTPTSFAPRTLRLGVSLSNMNGIDYRLPVLASAMSTGKPFITTLYSDTAHFQLPNRATQAPETWERLIEAAIASSSFPIAFQPEDLLRFPADYPDSTLSERPSSFFPSQGGRKMTFLDGGIFNNEPLEEAIRLAREADGGIPEPDRL
ncbi:MAG: patatin-like phospholipase family protein, partial [Cyanobacteria bacterium P01_A01_bin.70]